MRLVGRRRDHDLNGTHQMFAVKRSEQNPIPRLHSVDYLAKESFAIGLRERVHKADGSSALHAFDKHFGECGKVSARFRSTQIPNHVSRQF
jgi:hypothetical protein